MRHAAPVVALILAVSVLGAGCAATDDDGARTTTVTTTVTTEAQAPEPALECSAGEPDTHLIELEPADDDVPGPVAALREQLFVAAVNCQFDELQRLAGGGGEGTDFSRFSYTFGEPGPDGPAAYWRRADDSEDVMRVLARILTTPHGTIELDGDDDLFVWPSAHVESPSGDDWDALVASGAYPEDQVEAFREDGVYYGYRVGIGSDGTWSYFIAGD